MKKSLSIFLCVLSFSSFAQTVSKYIVTDQFGYRTTDQKIAVLRDPQVGFDAAESYTPGASFALVNELTSTQVFTGSAVLWNSGTTDAHSGDKVWHFDFSSVTSAGTYYVLDVTNNVKSYSFEIKDDVYNEVLKHAVRTFFYQRANFAKTAPYAGAGWTDGASHMGPNQQMNCRYYLDESNASLEKDLRGGWFDAGDFYKYTPWTAGYVMMMLKAYRDNPTAWTDDYNLPESGNQIPDLLDEVKWGMDYLRRLQNVDGSLIALVSGPGGSPPSSATGKCLYGKVTTPSALRAAAAFALGSKVYRMIGFNCYADTLQEAAEKAWVWSKNNPSVDWDNSADNLWKTSTGGWAGGKVSYDAYNTSMLKLEAAVYLYDLTGTAEYKTYFEANYDQCEFMKYYWLNPSQHDYQEALFHYTSLSGVTPAVVTNINNRATAAMNKATPAGMFFGAYDTKYDAYLSYLKDYVWGSNASKCAVGLTYYEAIKYGITPSRSADAMIAAENHIHYVHGLNALSKNYLSNMSTYGADNSVTEFFHSWFTDGSALWDKVGVSTYGPPPGFLVGGATQGYQNAACCNTLNCGNATLNARCTSMDISKFSGQPQHKSYADFNTDWPMQPWMLTENSCGYQATYIRLLSHFVKKLGAVPTLDDCMTTNTVEVAAAAVQIFPNPSNEVFYVLCPENFTAEIYSIDGKLMEKIQGRGNLEFGKNLAAGTYTVKVYQSNDCKNFKVVKL